MRSLPLLILFFYLCCIILFYLIIFGLLFFFSALFIFFVLLFLLVGFVVSLFRSPARFWICWGRVTVLFLLRLLNLLLLSLLQLLLLLFLVLFLLFFFLLVAQLLFLLLRRHCLLRFFTIGEFLQLCYEEAVKVVDVRVNAPTEVHGWGEALFLVGGEAWFADLQACFDKLDIPVFECVFYNCFVLLYRDGTSGITVYKEKNY